LLFFCPHPCSPPHIRRPLLNPKALFRLPQLPHFLMAQTLVHFLHIHKLLDCEDLTGDVGRDGVVDGAHALVEAKGFQNAAGFGWQADGGAHEGDAEEGHAGRVLSEVVVADGLSLLVLLIGVFLVFLGIVVLTSRVKTQ
jgi:hypothetical protein